MMNKQAASATAVPRDVGPSSSFGVKPSAVNRRRSASAERVGRLRRRVQWLQYVWRRWGPEFSGWKEQRHLFLLALVSALVMRLAYPRWNLFPVAAVGLAPFLWAVSHAASGKQAFYLGWLYGAVFYYVLLIWLNILVVYHVLIPPAILLLGLYLGLFKGLFARLMWETRDRPWWALAIVPAAWVAIEYLQSLGDLGFPWGYLGHSLWRHPKLIQLAAWTGVYGLSLILFWVNYLACDIVRCLGSKQGAPPSFQMAARVAILPFFGIVILLAALDSSLRSENVAFYTTTPRTVGLVQPNIPQREKFRSYDPDSPEEERERLQSKMLFETVRLTYQLTGTSLTAPKAHGQDARATTQTTPCDLIVWPESAVTDDLFTLRPAYATLFGDLATTVGAPVLFGATNLLVFRNGRLLPAEKFDPTDYRILPEDYSFEIYNSTFLAEPGRGLHRRVYNKMQLVPFAEGIPYVQHVRPLVSVISAIAQMEPFKPGKDHTVYEIASRAKEGPPLRFGSLICFESCYPRLSRALVRHGAEMLVIITNDGWYERTAGPAQHQLEAVFRAVETRRWVVRCANTGISCFISPFGEIEKETELAEEATPTWQVRGVKELTFYARWADVFAWLMAAMTAGFVIVRWVARRRST